MRRKSPKGVPSIGPTRSSYNHPKLGSFCPNLYRKNRISMPPFAVLAKSFEKFIRFDNYTVYVMDRIQD
jgi:hypothetical protein